LKESQIIVLSGMCW